MPNQKYTLDAFHYINNTPIKVEVFLGSSTVPYIVLNYKSLTETRRIPYGFVTKEESSIQGDLSCWELPTLDTFFRVFWENKQKVFEKLYLGNEGGILTVIKFTVEGR